METAEIVQIIVGILGGVVTLIIGLVVWIVNKIYDLDKKIDLNTQNDKNISSFMEKMEGTMEKVNTNLSAIVRALDKQGIDVDVKT